MSVAHTTARALEGAARELFRRAGYDLTRRSYYSPIPDPAVLPAALWDRPATMPAVDLRLESAVGLLAELRPFIAEFAPRRDRAPGSGFYLDNGAYESVDAEVLYALLRLTRPAQVVELGSGCSSHVIDAARVSNEADGGGFGHQIYDPFPFAGNSMGPVPGAEVHPVPAEEIDLAVFDMLEDGDVLFVDTTHTVRIGGDVTRIVLDALPRLAPGVLVHFHDVFLPFEYPRAWVLEHRRAWAEQYLLQAFLAFNDAFEVVFPAAAVAALHADSVAAAVPSFAQGVEPGAFWIRRRRRD